MTAEATMTIVGEVIGDNVVYVSGEPGLKTQKFEPEAQEQLLDRSIYTCTLCAACGGIKKVTEFGVVRVNEKDGAIPENLLTNQKCRLVNSKHKINRIWLDVASNP